MLDVMVIAERHARRIERGLNSASAYKWLAWAMTNLPRHDVDAIKDRFAEAEYIAQMEVYDATEDIE